MKMNFSTWHEHGTKKNSSQKPLSHTHYINITVWKLKGKPPSPPGSKKDNSERILDIVNSYLELISSAYTIIVPFFLTKRVSNSTIKCKCYQLPLPRSKSVSPWKNSNELSAEIDQLIKCYQMPTTRPPGRIADGPISEIDQLIEYYHCAKFGAYNKNRTIISPYCRTISSKLEK